MKTRNIWMMMAALAMVACQPNQDVNQPEDEGINSQVIMRSCGVNGNQWEIMPEYPTAEEIAHVAEVIGSQVNPVSVAFPNGCTEYFIQHVTGAHHMYSYTDMNGAKHDGIDGTSGQEWMQVLENSGQWQHVYNFNCGKCDNQATHNSALMNDGFNGLKTMSEYASSSENPYCIFLIDNQYYIGIDFSVKKGDGEVPADGIYDDWIIKIIPLNGEIPNNENEEEEEEEEGDIEEELPSIGHVEIDIHQQEHKDWNEIKTSIHLRDTVDITILLPIPEAYQANPDDFDIRLGEKYEYLAQSIQIADKTYEIVFTVTHRAEGIEIFVGGEQVAPVLRAARALYGDGLTFEVHTYVKNEVDGVKVSNDLIWDMLKQTEMPVTSKPTYLFGQITSAFFDDEVKINNQEE